ncbi:EB module [Ancylostoma duodenale]|uniref:EB module n=1 Tax=Ancylostoma duodenale TaxID=51022 RepID=A0A0C2G2K3_9BILA|nr:EB module [Ancylostoma duodenale]
MMSRGSDNKYSVKNENTKRTVTRTLRTVSLPRYAVAVATVYQTVSFGNDFQFFSEINPGESGCTQNRQCEAVWPGAYCRSGECRCANNQPPFRTRDGLVCLNYGFCPLNGNNPKFRIENQVQQCYGGADATCEAIGALAYDCICDSDDCTVNNPISFCCPSREIRVIFDI